MPVRSVYHLSGENSCITLNLAPKPERRLSICFIAAHYGYQHCIREVSTYRRVS